MSPGGARAVARCDAMGARPFSDLDGGLYRGYLTPAHRASIEQTEVWMKAAGLETRLDAAGNLIGRYAGQTEGPALLLGSHLDTVRNGGRYDGPLGVTLAIECVARLSAEGRRLAFPIEVVAFGDEEGSRFPASMLCSRTFSGQVDPAALEGRDADGVRLADALTAFGLDPARYGDSAYPSGGAFAYVEAHIEQGPVLEFEDLPVGTVTAIAGQLRYRIFVRGRAGHAGTTAMGLRKDALAGAAEMILAAEMIARAGSEDVVATVGKISARPGAPNVIPGFVEMSLDVRAAEAEPRDTAAAKILESFASIARTRGLELESELLMDLSPSPCAPELMDAMDAAIGATGHRARRLVSGAGHDAMAVAKLCPTAMLFIRCREGISHHPAESVRDDDVEVALDVLCNMLDALSEARIP